MKTNYRVLTCVLALVLFLTKSNAQSWEWAKQISGKNSGFNISKTTAIKRSHTGDIYLSGTFNDTAIFGSTQFVSEGIIPGLTTSDGFVAKLNTTGDLIWLKQFKCVGSVEVNDIALDASGNVYAVGYFSGTLTLDTSTFKGANNNATLMICKFDLNGELKWMKTATNGTGGTSRGLAISVGNKEVVLAGSHEKIVMLGGTNIDAKGDFKFILARYDLDGNIKWAKSTGETNPLNPKLSLVSDTKGNFYLTGSVSDVNTMDTIPFDALNGGSFFVAAFDSTGGILWMKKSVSPSLLDFGSSIALGNLDMLYVTGAFAADVFTVGGISVNRATNLGGRDFFVLKLSTNGNVSWIRQSHGTAPDARGMGITANSDSSVFVAGRFGSPTTGSSVSLDIALGEGANAKLLTNGGLLDVFVAKYDHAGNLIWVDKASGLEAHECYAITGDGQNSAYVTGIFRLDIAFGSINLKSKPYPGNNMFYAKTNGNANSVSKIISLNPIIYPQPAEGLLNITVPESTSNMDVYLYNLHGKLLHNEKVNNSTIGLKVDDQLPGIYLLRILYNNKEYNSKVMLK